MASSGGVTVRVEGLNKTVRALRQAGTDVTELKDLMQAIGNLIVNDAEPPRQSGALASNIRAGRGATKAVVRAGSARVPYAGVQNYGWPSRGIIGTHFLNEAADRQKDNAISALDHGIEDIIRRNNL